ncbi:MAG: GNAT family N-acetyltransferase [Ilumatobacteraceae bacterium]
MTMLEVVEIDAADTHGLRLSVLRFDTPTKEVSFAEDNLDGVVHLGVRDRGAIGQPLVAVSSWVPRQYVDPVDGSVEEHAVQLRGMATDRALQGTGIGGLLLDEAVVRMAAAGHRVAWARARDAALRFYERHGFAVRGDGFVDETTQLPHHLVMRSIASDSPSVWPVDRAP